MYPGEIGKPPYIEMELGRLFVKNEIRQGLSSCGPLDISY